MNEKDSSRNSISSEETLNWILDTLLEVNSPDMENVLPAVVDVIEETNRF
jgi:hypothetical protein